MIDLLIRGGEVIDGTGSPRHAADVTIRGDRIELVGRYAGQPPRCTIDAAGCIVAPGFIDLHNHSDGWLLKHPNFASKTLQGVTTEVLMSDGISYAPTSPRNAREWIHYLRPLNGLQQSDYTGWETLADYFTLLDGHTAQNVMAQIPYANLRVEASGWCRRTLDDVERKIIRRMIEQGMDVGAVGVSTGLDYVCECYASTDELADTLGAMRPQDGLYVTHIRYKLGLLPALREAVEIARRAGVKLHISHLKPDAETPAEAVFAFLDGAAREVDLSFDVYPYAAGSTLLSSLLPYAVWDDGPSGVAARLHDPAVRRQFAVFLETMARNRLDRVRIAWVGTKANAGHQGRTLADYAAAVGKPAADALCDLLLEENLAVLCVFHVADDSLIEPMLEHPRFLLGSDGIYQPDGPVHPRQFGSAPRLLGRLVRDRRLFALETAVRKMTALPAERFGLTDRGVLRPGAFADVVIFDPATVDDPATYDDPRQLTTGVRHVLVNGQPIVADGRPLDDARPGRWLRYRQA